MNIEYVAFYFPVDNALFEVRVDNPETIVIDTVGASCMIWDTEGVVYTIPTGYLFHKTKFFNP